MGKCKKTTVIVQGKISTVQILSCSDVQVVMENVINAVEVTDCKKVKFQITGSCPTAAIDKTDSCMVYLMSEDAKKMQISASKHSNCNITYMNGDDPVELPIPEQFVFTLNDSGKLDAKVSDLYSS